MTVDLAILVRRGRPAVELAQLMVERLDFDRRRDLGLGLVVHRRYPDGGFTLHVEAEAPWSGYDVALTGDVGDEMLAGELLDEFAVLGRPVALRRVDELGIARPGAGRAIPRPWPGCSAATRTSMVSPTRTSEPSAGPRSPARRTRPARSPPSSAG